LKTIFKFDKGSIFLILIILVVAAAVVFFYVQTRTDTIADAIEKEDPLTMAFMVVDDEEELLFTEVFFYHPKTKKGAILDIPRQTGIVIPAKDQYDRISFLFDQKNPQSYLDAVSNMIDTEIPFYFVLTLDQVVKQVDLLEGLDLFHANPLEMPDERIFLPSGSLVLDGAKTRLFVTYKEPGALAIEQTDRWEKFTQSLLKTWGSQREYLLIDRVFSSLRDEMKTNLTVPALKSFITEMGHLDAGRMVFQRVLGVEREVDDKQLLFRHKDGVLLIETVRQTMKSIGNLEVVSDEELSTSVEILNGTDTAGLASRTGQLFKSFGYDVVEVGNADQGSVEYTVVIDRSGDISRAQRVAGVIKCSRVERGSGAMDINEGSIIGQSIDVTIILGKDFDGRYCKE